MIPSTPSGSSTSRFLRDTLHFLRLLSETPFLPRATALFIIPSLLLPAFPIALQLFLDPSLDLPVQPSPVFCLKFPRGLTRAPTFCCWELYVLLRLLPPLVSFRLDPPSDSYRLGVLGFCLWPGLFWLFLDTVRGVFALTRYATDRNAIRTTLAITYLLYTLTYTHALTDNFPRSSHPMLSSLHLPFFSSLLIVLTQV